MVGVEGFEPTVTGSEPVALPLGDTPAVGGGGNRDRTDDIELAKLALSQRSYTPRSGASSGGRSHRLRGHYSRRITNDASDADGPPVVGRGKLVKYVDPMSLRLLRTVRRANPRSNPAPSPDECRRAITLLEKEVDNLSYAPLFDQENGGALWRFRGQSALYDINLSGRPTGYRLVWGKVEYDSHEPLHTLLILNHSSEVVARFPFHEYRDVSRLLEEAGINYFNRRSKRREEVPVLMKYALTEPYFKQINLACQPPDTREDGWYEMDVLNYVFRRPPEFHSGRPRYENDDY